MRKTKKIALTSLCAALGTVFLSVGVLLNVLDMTAALLASFLVLFSLLEMGYAYALALFAVTSLLSLILMPQASAPWMFLLLFGYIPISKFGFEHLLGRIFSWIPKLVIFNGVYAVMIFLLGELLGFTVENAFGIPPHFIYIAFFAVGNLVYLLCDILYGRLARLYMVKFRERFSRYLK
ncbi:MAG: hypothetical protein IJD59_04245 [Clostridia bacterium]|nr:hypothetical protein [Clostridia bacterium]